jgi:cell division protein FtsZ
MVEVDEAAKQIAAAVDTDANIIFGATIDENLVDQVKITVIATGFDETKRRLRELTGRPVQVHQPSYSQAGGTGTFVNPIQTSGNPAVSPATQTPPTATSDELPPEEDEFDIPAFLRQKS